MSKRLFLFCVLIFLFSYSFCQESEISDLITRFDNLPEKEKNYIMKKYPAFNKSILDRFKNLSEDQKLILIQKSNIDLNRLEVLIKKSEQKQFENEKTKKRKGKSTKSKNPIESLDKLKLKRDSKRNAIDKESLENLDKKTLLAIVQNLLGRDRKIEELKKVIQEKRKRKVYSNLTSRGFPKINVEADSLTNQTVLNLDGQKTQKEKAEQIQDLLFNYKFKKRKKEPKLILFGQSLFKKPVRIVVKKDDEDTAEFPEYEDEVNQEHISVSIMPEDYILGPGDSLAIELFGSKNNTFQLKIKKDGNSSFPGLGPIFLNGISFKKAKEKINRLVKTKMLNTKVLITSGLIKNINVFLLGEVSQPGVISISGLSSFVDALKIVGGVSAIGSLRRITIKRNSKTIGTFDLYPFLKSGDISKFQSLRNGDVIVCPVVGPLVSVSGSIKRSAIYELIKTENINDVIKLAGGLSSDAMAKGIQVKRVVDNKKIIIDLDLTQVENLNFLVQDGDHILVPSILDELHNGILLIGNVHRAKHYSYSKGIRISKLIYSKDLLKENTAMHYAVVQRQNGIGKEPILKSFNLEKAFNGDLEEDLELLPKDKVFIFHNNDLRESPAVKVEGFVLNPGNYNWTKGMRVSNLVLASGGVRFDAYLEKAEIYRWDSNESKLKQIVIDLKKALSGNSEEKNLNNIRLEIQDRLVIHALSEIKIKYEVTIKGSIHNPNKYLFFEGMRVSDLIFTGGSLTENANKFVASILRVGKKKDNKSFTKYIKINLEEVLKGNKLFNIEMFPLDELTIFESKHRKENLRVSVLGQVKNPGSYIWGEDMRVSNLIQEAGGIEDSAFVSKAEITHYKIINGKERFTEHEVIDLKLALVGNEKHDILLKPNDQIIILKIPGWTKINTVKLSGEIKYPGVYTIEKGEKLFDVIKRAGGLTADAYLYAGFFSREKNRRIQRENLNKRADELERRVSSLTATNKANTDDFGAKVISIESGKNLINKIRNATVTGRIALDFEDARMNLMGNNNIELITGDEIKIPRKSQVIFIIGEVRNPTSFILKEKGRVKDYIQRAGGYSDFANKKGVYVIRANGSIIAKNNAGYKKKIFGKSRKNNTGLRAGDTIVVPEKLNKFSSLSFTKDISQIFFQIALTVAAFAGL
ncbi:MAG: hypothetical protein COA79_06265 [Planctomycetota bacterium]|nr:MAG: hypothetical protein COA79_06265 [Planctomycetota bacterium]